MTELPPRFAIYTEDCVTGMARHLPPGSVSVVVTSPPYNRSKAYREYKDDLPRTRYLEWLESVGGEIRKVLASAGSLFLNVGGSPRDPWLAWDVAQRFRKFFVLQNTIFWVKSIAVPPEELIGNGPFPRGLSLGHYAPINSSRYLNPVAEVVFHFTHRGDVPLDRLAIGVPYKDKTNVRRWHSGGGDRRDRGNVWFVPYPTIHRARAHPSPFPSLLPELCLRVHGVDRIRRVLDPFLGSGATAVAAARLGLPCVGFEIDPYYVRIAQAAVVDAGGMLDMNDGGAEAPRTNV